MAVRNCLFRGVFPRSARAPRRPRLTFPCRREPCRLLRRLYGRAWPFRVQRWPAQAESAGAGGGGTRFATWNVNCGTSSSAAARFLHLFKFGLVVYGTSVFRGQAAIVRFPPVSFLPSRPAAAADHLYPIRPVPPSCSAAPHPSRPSGNAAGKAAPRRWEVSGMPVSGGAAPRRPGKWKMAPALSRVRNFV